MKKESKKNGKECKSPEEIAALAKEKGVECSGQQTKDDLEKSNFVNGEVSDDALDSVAGSGSEEEVKYCPKCGSRLVRFMYYVNKNKLKTGWTCRKCDPNNPHIQPF